MIYRQQSLQNCVKVLGYMTHTDIQNISSLKMSLEEYLAKKLTGQQLNLLRLFFIKYIFLSEIRKLSVVQPTVIDKIFNHDLQNAKNNQPPQFGDFEKKIAQHPSFLQITPHIQQILTVEEMKILDFMLGKAPNAPSQPIISNDTRKGTSTRSESEPQKIDGIPKILGDYKILETIGAGGMGKVFKAYHQNLERIVAIKVMLGQEEIARKRFLIEAKLTAKMQHPNIIPIHDIQSEGQLDYIVMDFIQGKTLSEVLQHKRLSFPQIVTIIKPILSAVAYAHNHQVIHRDLKPANILLEDETLRPIVMDFGLAKQLERQTTEQITVTGQLLGSPRYMAPEQAETEEVDHRADIYALGTIFYEMLTGQPAIDGERLGQVIYKITQQKYLRPREVNPEIPAAVEKICLKAMALNREERYQTADEFMTGIDYFMTHGKTTANVSFPDMRNTNGNKGKRRNVNEGKLQKTSIRPARKTSTLRTNQRQKTTQKKNNTTVIISVCTAVFLLFLTFYISQNNTPSVNQTKLAQQKLEKQKIKFQQQLKKQKEKAAKEQQRLKEQLAQQKAQKTPQEQPSKNLKLQDIVKYNDKQRYVKISVKKIAPALQEIRHQTRPIFLSFRNTTVKDDDLRYIQNAPYIIALDLQETRVGNAVLKYVATLKNLKLLDIEGTKITGEGLQYLTNPHLREIDLDETNITDQHAHYLKNISSSLVEINLEGTQISDKSIPILSSLKSLKRLKILRTKITPSGFYQLQNLMPYCQIIY
ncbi:serine/threonine-protein kinase [Candidatus Uabimicrobium amorphum]|uniref:non-specific serine/threonine protein kinase n=1 Tax=Uabimicrobium amorphum TaxID=2596890 RepID=A0A5S9INN9_UABAM|nr:serine/threonine-protein kinase [Candidatus Uabimicrobium amorphum]BBM84776.1 serine/threonine protein kinase [Candidatus Uabimicrobium amorphum]